MTLYRVRMLTEHVQYYSVMYCKAATQHTEYTGISVGRFMVSLERSTASGSRQTYDVKYLILCMHAVPATCTLSAGTQQCSCFVCHHTIIFQCHIHTV